ncbi:HmuY family protein [Archangium violaceum]|uniref:HmuY family protein n=1 Tax=Archangium violaceum TaxID=83451 RepID=UPI00193B742F|nr:HmuY family protein [Archangium violaceum]QRK04992.1 HmuY family protein [Archangium violaceum]
MRVDMRMRIHGTMLLLGLSVAGCATDLREDYPFDGQASGDKLVEVTAQEDGSNVAIIDATNKSATVFFDIDEGREMKTDEAFDTNEWDLSFQRYVITMNGGGGNPTGEVSVAVLEDTSWDALTSAPAEGYQQDASQPVFSDVEGGWYAYDLVQHKLVTRDGLLYVVRSSSGQYYKLRMLSYYDSAGTPARLSFRYQRLASPSAAP